MPPLSNRENVAPAKPPFFWGVDVGGTNIKIGLVDDSGRPVVFDSIETQPEVDPVKACQRVAAKCQQMALGVAIDCDQIVGCGVGAPGPLSLREGKLLDPSNLPAWHQFPIRDKMSEALKMPVSFINDANAAAFGEWWIGSGAGQTSLALLTLGTGVGGGVIYEGKLINGCNSFGSELGHIIVDCRPDARLCNWGGGQGQLEAYASASAVALRAQELIQLGTSGILHDTWKEAGRVTAKDVYLAAVKGDDLALQIVDETAFYLGVGIASAVHAVDPGLVVLGGAMNFGGASCPVGCRFIKAIRAEFSRRTFSNVSAGTKIEFARLGPEAGYIGAAGIARQASKELEAQA
ncbi:MAG: ROK family protein [Planctomycetales bacterium]|nr:ROK family protein [Planctomycetales bacterium]